MKLEKTPTIEGKEVELEAHFAGLKVYKTKAPTPAGAITYYFVDYNDEVAAKGVLTSLGNLNWEYQGEGELYRWSY